MAVKQKTGRRIFKCTTCNWMFTSKAGLDDHEATHVEDEMSKSWSPEMSRPKLESTRYSDSGLERSAAASPAFTDDANGRMDDDKFVADSLKKIISGKGGEVKERAYKNKMGALVKRFSI